MRLFRSCLLFLNFNCSWLTILLCNHIMLLYWTKRNLTKKHLKCDDQQSARIGWGKHQKANYYNSHTPHEINIVLKVYSGTAGRHIIISIPPGWYQIVAYTLGYPPNNVLGGMNSNLKSAEDNCKAQYQSVDPWYYGCQGVCTIPAGRSYPSSPRN